MIENIFDLLGIPMDEFPYEILLDNTWAYKNIVGPAFFKDLGIQDADIRFININGHTTFLQFRIEKDMETFMVWCSDKLKVGQVVIPSVPDTKDIRD